nr:hypothetical protein [Tanacetum cinerariifolium]
IPACCDDDDDHNSSITPNEPVDSLSMGDEHLNTIPATESDEFIKSCVENLVPNPSESEGKNGCDVHACFTTFSNVLFDVDYDFYSVDDQPCSDEDVLERIFSNPLFNEEINSTKIDPHHFNAESDLIESLLNHDSFIIYSSSKIDSLLDEFADELTLLKSVPPGIDETNCYPEEEFRVKTIDNRIYFLRLSSAIFSAVASLLFWQWELSSLVVETSSSSGNFITSSGNALCILFPTILP